METPDIKLPVKMDDVDKNIVDARGRVICMMTWVGDLDHVRKQEEIGRWLCEIINSQHLNGTKEAGESKARNPWGRAGKPANWQGHSSN